MLSQFRSSFLSTEVFVRRAYKAVNAVASDDYFERADPEVKSLIEEVLPIAALLKNLERPERTVRCRYAGGNSQFDAEFQLSGREVEFEIVKPAYYVEVVTAAHPKDYQRRESLRRYGEVYGGPGIGRTGKASRGTADVMSFPVSVYGTVAPTLMKKWVAERIHAKAKRGYRQPCILVVNAIPERRLTPREWAIIAEAGTPEIRSAFDIAYIVHCDTNTVVPLQSA